MSTPDSRLSAAERAALADLEAAAAAADPGLAALLRGGMGRRLHADLRWLRGRLTKIARAVPRVRWGGVPITILGLFLMVLGLASAIVLSFAGALLTALGLAVLVQMAHLRLARAAEVRRNRTG